MPFTEREVKTKKRMEPNHGHDKQRVNEREIEGVGEGSQLEKWESLTK